MMVAAACGVILAVLGMVFLRPLAAATAASQCVDGIWLSIVVAEAMAVVVTVFFLRAKQGKM